jgi:hypothetical protein
MERWQIIVACVIFIIVWMMYKRRRDGGIRKADGSQADSKSVEEKVDSWYREAQEQMAMMEEDEKAGRIDAWEEMDQEAQLAYGKRFLAQTFGPATLGKYRNEEALRIGLAAFVITEQPEPIE